MTATNPPAEVQRTLIKQQIAAYKEQYWMQTTLAKAHKKSGFADVAKKNAELAAQMERVVDALEEELKAIKDEK